MDGGEMNLYEKAKLLREAKSSFSNNGIIKKW